MDMRDIIAGILAIGLLAWTAELAIRAGRIEDKLSNRTPAQREAQRQANFTHYLLPPVLGLIFGLRLLADGEMGQAAAAFVFVVAPGCYAARQAWIKNMTLAHAAYIVSCLALAGVLSALK
jgi:hypothetical protein